MMSLLKRSLAMTIILLLSGCRTFEVGLVQTATPDRSTVVPMSTLTLPPTAVIDQAAAAPTATTTAVPTITPTAQPARRPTSTPIGSAQPIGRSPTPTATLSVARIISFTVEPLQVDPGASVTVRWSTLNVDHVDIYQHTPDTLPAYITSGLSANGEITQVIRAGQRQWQAFELSASNGAGAVAQTITVTVRCPDQYFFSPLPVEDRGQWDCPDGAVRTSAAAEQVFENGRMIWLETEKNIYVVLNGGGLYTYPDTWTTDQPDGNPDLTPPAGRYLPVRGFGKVWSNDAAIRSKLGWATSEERAFEALIQGGWIHCCSRLDAVNRPIYLRNVEGRIIRLWPGEMPPGQWRFITP